MLVLTRKPEEALLLAGGTHQNPDVIRQDKP